MNSCYFDVKFARNKQFIRRKEDVKFTSNQLLFYFEYLRQLYKDMLLIFYDDDFPRFIIKDI